MKLINSRFYSALMIITDYLLLGLVWLICAFPIVTIYGATVSLMYVIDQWHEGESGNILRLFFHKFKERFFVKLLISFGFLISISVIYVDFTILSNLLSDDQKIITILIVTLLVLLMLFINLAFIDSRTKKVKFTNLFKAAVISFFTNFLPNLLGILLIILNSFFIFLLPITVFFTPIITAVALYKLNNRKDIIIQEN